MNDQSKDPNLQAKELAANNEPASATLENALKSVCLEAVGGWFVLSYQGDIPASGWDWIGLYASTSDSDDNYVGGNNWNWATKGRSYATSTAVATTGYEARYLIWDGSKYRSIKRSGPLKAACK